MNITIYAAVFSSELLLSVFLLDHIDAEYTQFGLHTLCDTCVAVCSCIFVANKHLLKLDPLIALKRDCNVMSWNGNIRKAPFSIFLPFCSLSVCLSFVCLSAYLSVWAKYMYLLRQVNYDCELTIGNPSNFVLKILRLLNRQPLWW